MKLSDIARLAGVSVTTASYVINGKAEQQRISRRTVERVRAVVEEHRFTPNPQAAGLRSRRTNILGFILPDLENPGFARIAKLLEQGARARGYQLLIASSDDLPDSERQLQQLFRARCDALIVASCLPAGDNSYQKLQEQGTPVIAITRALDPSVFSSVVSDDHAASLHLTRSLLQTKPRHIALIGAHPELSISQQRSSGFSQAVIDFQGEVLIKHGDAFNRDCGRQLMNDLIQRLGQVPDALVTASYGLLQGVFDALRAHPLKAAPIHLGTFGDPLSLDFLPQPVNAMTQQHALIADKVLKLALAAVEQQHYQPGIQTIARTLRQRIGEA